MKKSLFPLLLLPLLLHAAGGVTDLHGLQLKDVKIPVYDKKMLQVMIFSDTGKREDQVMIGGNTVLDALRPEVDVDKIIDGWKIKLYSLKAPLPEVLKFWTKRRFTSSAVMFTPQCFVNQQKKEAFGKAPVYMRAPMLDLNGIGFHTYFDKQVTEVAADVHITVRTSESDPREILAGTIPMPQRYAPVYAESDSLRIDMKHNEIMLIGNVKVIDGVNILTCDRLTVFLSDKTEKKVTMTGANPPPDSGTMLKGVSRILADGDVVLIRRAESGIEDTPLQTAHCAHLEYEIPIGKIALTDEEGQPLITQDDGSRLTGKRIELMRLQQKVFVIGSCHVETPEKEGGSMRVIDSDKGDFDGVSNTSLFSGNVKVTDSQMTMTCGTMRVHFSGKSEPAGKTDKSGAGYTEFSPVSGNGKLERIHCEKDVLIVEKIDPVQQKISEKPPKTISSQRADLNYSKDKLIFFDKVKVTDDQTFLHCDRLDLFLSERGASGSGGSPIAAGTPGQSKKLTKAIASGNVYMKDKEDDLRTELMNLYFRDKPRGAKESPGMFQSGEAQLTKIECCGKVVATGEGGANEQEEGEDQTATPGRRVLKAEYATSHLLKDYTEFHQNVSVADGSTTVFCRDMYAFSGTPPAEISGVVREENPDADPFELDRGENSAPSRISLGKNVDLKQIICRNEVVLNMRDGGQVQQTGGDNGVYTVSSGALVITSVRPNRPWIRSDGRRQFCDEIHGNLKTEELHGIGAIEVYPDIDEPQEE